MCQQRELGGGGFVSALILTGKCEDHQGKQPPYHIYDQNTVTKSRVNIFLSLFTQIQFLNTFEKQKLHIFFCFVHCEALRFNSRIKLSLSCYACTLRFSISYKVLPEFKIRAILACFDIMFILSNMPTTVLKVSCKWL